MHYLCLLLTSQIPVVPTGKFKRLQMIETLFNPAKVPAKQRTLAAKWMVAFSAASLIFLPTDGSTVLQNNKMGWVRTILLVWSYSYPNSIDSSWAFIPLTWYLIKICSAISIKKCDMFILSDYRTFWPKMKTGWGWPPWGYLQKRKTWVGRGVP